MYDYIYKITIYININMPYDFMSKSFKFCLLRLFSVALLLNTPQPTQHTRTQFPL